MFFQNHKVVWSFLTVSTRISAWILYIIFKIHIYKVVSRNFADILVRSSRVGQPTEMKCEIPLFYGMHSKFWRTVMATVNKYAVLKRQNRLFLI